MTDVERKGLASMRSEAVRDLWKVVAFWGSLPVVLVFAYARALLGWIAFAIFVFPQTSLLWTEDGAPALWRRAGG